MHLPEALYLASTFQRQSCSVLMVYSSRELGKLPQGDINAKLAMVNLSMIMSCTDPVSGNYVF